MRVKHYVWVLWAILIAIAFTFFGWLSGSTMVLLTMVSFIQNMSFTWVSRSRNSGDPDKHRHAAWASNGIWLLTQTFIAANIYTPIAVMVNSGYDPSKIGQMVVAGMVYALATTEGSVSMMKVMLGQTKVPILSKFFEERGKSQVGKR